MKNQDKLIAPGEYVIYSCEKELRQLPVLIFYWFIFGLIASLIAISKKQMFLLTFVIIYGIFIILFIRVYRRSYLILTNCRVLLRCGVLKDKTYSISFESIEAFKYLRAGFFIYTTDGKRIDLLRNFSKEGLEQLAWHVNDLRGEMVYLKPETDPGKQVILSIYKFRVAFGLIMLLFLLLYKFLKLIKVLK